MKHPIKNSRAGGRGFQFPLRGVVLAGLLLALAAPAIAAARTILVFGPHEDDETLIAAGRVRSAILAGDTVKLVLVTNGDVGGTGNGYLRQGESVTAAQALGLTEQDVIFMGYGDGSMFTIFSATSGTQVYRSAAGQVATYANRGLGGMEWHRYRTGVAGAYNRDTALADFKDLLQFFSPDEIYTVSNLDTHPDHEATALFVTEALVALKRAGSSLGTKVYHSIVWPPTNGNWPDSSGGGGCAGTAPFLEPPWAGQPQVDWTQVYRFPVPAEMQSPVASANLKCVAIGKYQSQLSSWLLSWARKDEFFWLNDFGLNQAITAQVTASSENLAGGHGALKAIDGVIDGDNNYPGAQWETVKQLAGAWIQLAWPSPVRIGQINLFDRPDANQNILAGTLSFSDGTSIAVGALPAGGHQYTATFSPKTVTWVRFTVTQAQGTAVGLSEFQVLGSPASSTVDVAPNFISGPVPSAPSIKSSQSAVFTVSANDVDGDALQYQWSADGGSVVGNGATAVFTPPAVGSSTVFTITSQVLDGRGGGSTNAGFITVTPATNGFSVNPTVVATGGSAVGTVALAAPAPVGGTSVPLSSSNSSAATVPSSVLVPVGSLTATFNITAGSVAADTSVTITATIGGVPYTAALTVSPVPPPPPPPPTAGNLLGAPNAIGTPPWEDWGSITTTPNYGLAPDGTQTASRTLVTVAGGHALVQADVAVSPGTAYVLSFHAKNNGGSAASYSVYDNNHGADIVRPTSYVSQINGTSWTQLSVPFTTPAGCTSINVYLVRDSGFPVDLLLWGAALAPYTPPPATASLSVSPSSVVSEGSATGTVVLAAPAPVGGLVVPLSSSNPSAASVPSSITVAQGATTGTFSINALSVATATPVVIGASLDSGLLTANLLVSPLLVSSISLSPATIVGGGTAQGTVTLNGPAGAQGAAVQLSTPDPTLVGLPVGVVVPAGSTSATFSLSTAAVTATTVVTVTASDGIGTASATLTISPLTLTAIALNPATVLGGASSVGTVTLNSGAPGGGAAVALVSADSAVAGVPASVTVASGLASATFPVTTAPVSASTPVSITAAYGGTTVAATLTVSATSLSTFALAAPSAVGGGTTTGTVTLAAAAPAAGTVVTITSSNVTAATVPASVTVPAGATTATFTITTVAVTAGASTTITASAGGVSRTATLAVRALSLTRSPTAVAGGASSVGTVRLSAAVTSPTVIALATANPVVATVPASVTIPAGSTTATFSIGTSPVTATVAVNITAAYGTALRTVSLSVRIVTASALTLTPTSVIGGTSSTGRVTISIAAPPGGTLVTLRSSRTTVANVPASVTVAAGATSATFSVATSAVAASTTSSISGTAGGVTRSATLTVTP